PQWTPVLVLVLLIVLLAWRPAGVLEQAPAAPGSDDRAEAPPTVVETARPGTRWLLLALLVLGLAYPLVDQAMGWQRVASVTAILVLVTLGVGLSVVVGLAGLIDLGYAAFFAIGGYTTALLTSSGSRFGLMLPDV